MDYRLEILGFNLNFGRDFDVFQEHGSCCSQNSTVVFYKSDVDSPSSYFIGYFLRDPETIKGTGFSYS